MFRPTTKEGGGDLKKKETWNVGWAKGGPPVTAGLRDKPEHMSLLRKAS